MVTLHRNQISLLWILAGKLLTLQPVKKTDTHSFQILVAIFFKNKKPTLYQLVKDISRWGFILVRLLLLKKAGGLPPDSK